MLAIVWHSRTGAARAMAQAAHDGAGPRARMIAAADAHADMLLAAAAFLFICPENLGSMTGAMKEMFDQAYYPLLGKIEGKPYATVIAAGSDGHGAQAQIDRIVKGWRLRRVADPLIINTNAQSPEAVLRAKTLSAKALGQCRDLGAALSHGVELGIY